MSLGKLIWWRCVAQTIARNTDYKHIGLAVHALFSMMCYEWAAFLFLLWEQRQNHKKLCLCCYSFQGKRTDLFLYTIASQHEDTKVSLKTLRKLSVFKLRCSVWSTFACSREFFISIAGSELQVLTVRRKLLYHFINFGFFVFRWDNHFVRGYYYMTNYGIPICVICLCVLESTID